MQNIAIINVVKDRSTGKIALNLLNQLSSKGYNTTFFYGRGEKSNDVRLIRIEKPIEVYIHAFLSRLTGRQGFYSRHATKKMLDEIARRDIDTIILINPHAYYLNEKLFYTYVSQKNLRFISIIPDEFAYLGNCTNEPKCERYITGKGKCPNIHQYPNSWFFDSCPAIMSSKEYYYKQLKRAVFVGPEFVIKKLRSSYLGRYMPSAILDEAIDIELYHPCHTEALRKRLGIEMNKIVILCIAPSYKGVVYFKQVAMALQSDARFVFVHVGKDVDSLNQSNYVHIEYVKENSDLAVYYSMADLFLFPSMADTMSNACIESLACGTPLLVFNVSGMPYLLDSTVGTMVEPRNVEELIKVVSQTRKKTDDEIQTCRKYAERRYDSRNYTDKVVEIANSIL